MILGPLPVASIALGNTAKGGRDDNGGKEGDGKSEGHGRGTGPRNPNDEPGK